MISDASTAKLLMSESFLKDNIWFQYHYIRKEGAVISYIENYIKLVFCVIKGRAHARKSGSISGFVSSGIIRRWFSILCSLILYIAIIFVQFWNHADHFELSRWWFPCLWSLAPYYASDFFNRNSLNESMFILNKLSVSDLNHFQLIWSWRFDFRWLLL